MNRRVRLCGQRIRNLRRRLAAVLIAIGATSLPAWGTASAHDHATDWNLGPIVKLDELIGSKRVSFISPVETRAWSSPVAPATPATPAIPASDVAARVAEYRRLQESLGRHWTPLAWSTAGIPLAQLSSPISIDPVVTQALENQPAEAELAGELAALASEEPVDAAIGPVNPDAAWVALELPEVGSTAAPAAEEVAAIERPRYAEIAGIGVAPVIATLEEPYLAYDMSPEDLIAMRMYPIPGADADYLGGRRTGADVHGPGLHEGLAWEQVTEPAEVVSTAETVALNAEPVAVAENAPAAPQASWLVDWAQLVMAEEATGETLRAWLDPVAAGRRIGELVADGNRVMELAVARLAGPVVAAWTPDQPSAAESLMAAATLLEPRPEAIADSTLVVEPLESPRVPPLELAQQTALDIVTAQAAEGVAAAAAESPAAPVEQVAEVGPKILDPVARAEAVATACDHAASTLERLAMSLRRAGDTLVRQAKAGSAGADGSMLR